MCDVVNACALKYELAFAVNNARSILPFTSDSRIDRTCAVSFSEAGGASAGRNRMVAICEVSGPIKLIPSSLVRTTTAALRVG